MKYLSTRLFSSKFRCRWILPGHVRVPSAMFIHPTGTRALWDEINDIFTTSWGRKENKTCAAIFALLSPMHITLFDLIPSLNFNVFISFDYSLFLLPYFVIYIMINFHLICWNYALLDYNLLVSWIVITLSTHNKHILRRNLIFATQLSTRKSNLKGEKNPLVHRYTRKWLKINNISLPHFEMNMMNMNIEMNMMNFTNLSASIT